MYNVYTYYMYVWFSLECTIRALGRALHTIVLLIKSHRNCIIFCCCLIKCSWHPSDSRSQCCQCPVFVEYYSMSEFMVICQLITERQKETNLNIVWIANCKWLKVNNNISKPYMQCQSTNNNCSNGISKVVNDSLDSSSIRKGMKLPQNENTERERWKKPLNHKSWIAVPAIYIVYHIYL